MKINSKIINDQLESISKLISQKRSENHSIVLCEGHFNTIHPGHTRFLDFAKSHATFLVIALPGKKRLEEPNRSFFYPSSDRARGVSSLEVVDSVFIYNEVNIVDLIETIKPEFYIKGQDHSKKPELISSQIEAVEKNNGKVVFGSGDITYSTADAIKSDIDTQASRNFDLLYAAMKRQNIITSNLKTVCESIKDSRILVIGDTIVDQYIACDALGMSSEAPVLVVKQLGEKEFIGGGAIVARHVNSLGADCTYLSVLGEDGPADRVESLLKQEGIATHLLRDSERPTTYKIRYMVDTQKLFRVSKLKEHNIDSRLEDKICEILVNDIEKYDGIIISDFVYGMITPKIINTVIRLAEENNIKLFGDLQCSSQIGNVSKFVGFELITPTEKEARIAMNDSSNGLELLGSKLLKKTNSNNVIITLGEKGFIVFRNINNNSEQFIDKQYFPALNNHPLDVVGAGDSLLASLAVCLCSGADIMESAAIAAGVASIAVGKIGNQPISQGEIFNWIEHLNE